MDNWPLFDERYAPDTIVEAPPYQDLLIVLLISSLAIGATLWAIQKKRHQHKVIHRLTLLDLYLSIQTVVLAGLLIAKLTTDTSAPFWSSAAIGLLYSTGYLLVHLLLYTIIWYAFGTKELAQKWFGQFFKLWGVIGVALALPLALSLWGGTAPWLLTTVIGIIFYAFRILLIYITFSIFPKLLRYPVHIILYLCTCEIATVLFLLV